jgi:hypothetical protein
MRVLSFSSGVFQVSFFEGCGAASFGGLVAGHFETAW